MKSRPQEQVDAPRLVPPAGVSALAAIASGLAGLFAPGFFHSPLLAAAPPHSDSSARAPAIETARAIRAIVGEAANEGAAGMLAVAGAIRNRGSLKGVYGERARHVDFQPDWVWRAAADAWQRSATNDITRGATHWENPAAFGLPRWARSMQITTNIGAHTFFKPAPSRSRTNLSAPRGKAAP